MVIAGDRGGDANDYKHSHQRTRYNDTYTPSLTTTVHYGHFASYSKSRTVSTFKDKFTLADRDFGDDGDGLYALPFDDVMIHLNAR